MALQEETHTFSSVIRGHHVYKETWTPHAPYISEELTTNVEEENLFDRHAITVLKNGEIVGHMPRKIAQLSWFFVKRGGSIKSVVNRNRSRGTFCDYIYSGPRRMKEVAQSNRYLLTISSIYRHCKYKIIVF